MTWANKWGETVTIKRALCIYQLGAINQSLLFLFPTYFSTPVLTFFVCIPLCVRLTYKSVMFAFAAFVARRKSWKVLFNLSVRSLYFQYYYSVLFRDAPFVSRIALMYLKCDAHCCPCFMFKGNSEERGELQKHMVKDKCHVIGLTCLCNFTNALHLLVL